MLDVTLTRTGRCGGKTIETKKSDVEPRFRLQCEVREDFTDDAAELKPWPGQPAAIATCGASGRRSIMRCPSGESCTGTSSSGASAHPLREIAPDAFAQDGFVFWMARAVHGLGIIDSLASVIVLADFECRRLVRRETVDRPSAASMLKTGKRPISNSAGRAGWVQSITWRSAIARRSSVGNSVRAHGPAVTTRLRAPYRPAPVSTVTHSPSVRQPVTFSPVRTSAPDAFAADTCAATHRSGSRDPAYG